MRDKIHLAPDFDVVRGYPQNRSLSRHGTDEILIHTNFDTLTEAVFPQHSSHAQQAYSWDVRESKTAL
ncbi:hypothetical protein BTUL_0123g00050 [Botrytis tulipae]|uniref:Uncharacterized protein n=1 Tax=Botrytis tulipae TaxID=87230 RepID=A0A4Z1EEL9_9HELO|nr:hypothetical protein BTUL_0123g00050 [Botrytis tulipae]